MTLAFLVTIDISDDDQKKLDTKVVADRLMETLALATGMQLVALQGAKIKYLGAN